MQETYEKQVWSLGQEDPLEKVMATHSSILAWKIPWTEEPGWLLFMGSQRVGHYWATSFKRLWEEVSSRHFLLRHFGWSLIPFSKANIYKAVTLIIMLMQFYYFCFSCFSFALVQHKILNMLFLNILYIYISGFFI